MNFFGIIPARYASSRFPGKPLVLIQGKSMIQRVYEQASKSTELAQVVVATDDSRIFEHVKNFGGKVILTNQAHASGTDRCYEAAKLIDVAKNDVVINIQGDEPYIHPEQIDLIASCFKITEVNIATLVKKIVSLVELENTSTPKVILNHKGEAIYFSRSILPHVRGKNIQDWLSSTDFYKHIGIYAYRFTALAEITQLQQSKLELAESLEQLRWIENGYKIHTALTSLESIAIDTPNDLEKLNPS